MDKTPAPIFRRQNAIPSSALPSSSPSFGTPVHPPKPFNVNPPKATILPIILPPATLRPLAFRTFTKKHSLTLTSSVLQELASFIGRHCGSGWREEGLAERVLEEVARSWKNRNGGVIVDGNSKELHDILKTLEGNMSGGKIVGAARGLPRGDSMLEVMEGDAVNTRLGLRPTGLTREDSNASFGMSGLGVQEEALDDVDDANEPRAWLNVISSFDQPRLIYNVGKKHFERYGNMKARMSIHVTQDTNFNSEKLQKRHYYPLHGTKLPCFETAIRLFINASCEMKPSRYHLWLRLLSIRLTGHCRTKILSKSRPLPTCLADTAAITCSLDNWSSYQQVTWPSVT